jgi:hypothetical protein
MIKNNGLGGQISDEFPDPKIIDLVGRILASAAKSIQEKDPADPGKMEKKKNNDPKLNITWKN